MAGTEPSRNEINEGRPGAGNPGQPITSLSLLERARASDAEAWRLLVKLYRPWCCSGATGWRYRRGRRGPEPGGLCRGRPGTGRVSPRSARTTPSAAGWRYHPQPHPAPLPQRMPGHPLTARGGSDAWANCKRVTDPLAGCEHDEQVEFGRCAAGSWNRWRDDFEDKTWQAFWLTVIEGRTPATLTEAGHDRKRASVRPSCGALRRLKQEVAT